MGNAGLYAKAQHEMRQELLADIQRLENMAHSLKMTITARGLNQAKNALGWEMAGCTKQAAKAASGIRPGEKE